MFVRNGCFWRFVPMLSPDDGGGAPADSGASANDGGASDGGNQEAEHKQDDNSGSDELAKLKLELAKQKEAINKATKEAADYKRQLRAKQTAEEIAAEEKKAQDEAQAKEIEELRKEIAKTKTIKNVMARLGTDEEVSGRIAESLYGAADVENVLTELQRVWEAQKKALRLEYGRVPAPGVGAANGAGEDEEAIKRAKELGKERAGSGKTVKESLGNYMR